MTYAEKLGRAIAGLELIRLSRTGPTTGRRANRKKGKALIVPFLKHWRPPGKLVETSNKIMIEINT